MCTFGRPPMGKRLLLLWKSWGFLTTIPINIGKGDQFKSEFLKISPNNKMPAIVDADGPGRKTISIFESGTMLDLSRREDRTADAHRHARPLQSS